jgi:hypothetical protein
MLPGSIGQRVWHLLAGSPNGSQQAFDVGKGLKMGNYIIDNQFDILFFA